ncbi:MAG: hypothetical protein LBH32_00235 [Dysgonamonadaceae bacterium]|nr:hypothetical protein [Dysgonamonadaceae bacterium]
MHESNFTSFKKIAGSLLTPLLGMIPVLVFLISVFFVGYQIALMEVTFAYLVFFVTNAYFFRYVTPYSVRVSICVFSLLIIFSFISPFNLLYDDRIILIFEIFLVFVYYMFILFKNFYREKILIKNEATRSVQLMRFDSDVYVMKIIMRLALAHLLIVLIYCLLPIEYHSELRDKLVYFILLYIFIALHLIYEFVQVILIREKYIAEKWLPVVDETGMVHGKVAQSISQSSGNKYLHPVIRIALIRKGMLYLKERPVFASNSIRELDYPFETYLKYKETLDEGVTRIFEENGGSSDLPLQYIFRYVFKNIKTNRLIYLYVCNIQDSNTSNLKLGKGKWWTMKQIEENLGKGFFSDYFEKEYELLGNIILKADNMMRGTESDIR